MLYCLAPSTSRLVQNLPRQSCVRRVSRRLAPKTLSRALGSSPSYHWIRDVELLERYRPGGYHPVSIGDCINCRYSIVDKLGFGDYSTVWLAHDTIASRYVALKIGTADASAKTSLEVRIIQELSSNDGYRSAGRDSIPAIFEAFEIKSPNGTHQAYAMTPARCNLWQAIEMSLFPLNVARALCGGLILAVARVHQHGYCHGDLHPGNILIRLPESFHKMTVDEFYANYEKPETIPITRRDKGPLDSHVPGLAVQRLDLSMNPAEYTMADARVLLTDFGESFPTFPGQARLGKDCHAPDRVRPPEALFEPDAPLPQAADIWMLAMALWNMLSVQSLVSDFASPDEYVAERIDILGVLPPAWRQRWAKQEAEFFDEGGQRKRPGLMIWPSLEKALEKGMQYWRVRDGVGAFDNEERPAFLDLLRKMLVWRPEARLSTAGVLESEWVRRWVMPDVERAQTPA